jgi:hypothetical protein
MTMDSPVRRPLQYRLRVQGHLDASWAPWLGQSALTHEPDATTSLLVTVTDQADLFGVLTKIRDMGVPLLALTGVQDSAGVEAQTVNFTPCARGSSPE